MVEDIRSTLRELLASTYGELKRKLTRRLGSADTAAEALHETYLRLDGAGEIEAVRNPVGLLYRMALLAAMDGYRAERRWLRRAELEGLQREAEDALTPERVAVARLEIEALEAALAEMPARRRAIFMAALIEDLPYRDIAGRFGISNRLVEREVRRGLDHAEGRLEKKSQRRAGRPRRGTSHEGTTDE
jgi:RNA polymerase sigma-70 factor, ECF subfamily